MSWASDCAERSVGTGKTEEDAIHRAITEALVQVLLLCDRARELAKAQGGFTYETVALAIGVFADGVRALMVDG